MSIYRARCSCPICSSEEEVWMYNGKISPIATIQCLKCTNLYEPTDFIVCFLELYQNVTVSTGMIQA